uniref:Tyrosine-protein phosphatase non-receptor type 23 n=1 Tax=Aceria tosichella TaxID=561515 RepID=A0A6G1SEY0_9ACAR
MTEELDEIKQLSHNQLACIVWPPRTPKDNASYINEFAEHIKNKFNEISPQKYSRELQEFSNLRNIALSILTESSFRDTNSLKALKKYYCQLVAILNRFKDCAATFPWKDAFGRGVNEGGLEFEINNIMYNIAAIHNEIGAKISKTSEPTTKDACLNFSNALWWVTDLRDNRNGLKPKEMGHDLLTFYHHVLQAQAQECILLHSIRAGLKPENVAKIAAQISNDYDIATKLSVTPLYTDPLRDIISGTSAFPAWRATVEFKYKYFSAITQLLAGLANREDSAKEIGTRIARLKWASQLVEQCKKLVSDTIDPNTSRAAFTTLEGLITRKHDRAIRYNDNVYHASIPSRETLPQVDTKLLVSPVPFSITSMPDFHDLFAGLVPIEAVQVNSLYSQKKDDLLRDTNVKVSKKDEELAQFLSRLNIDKQSLRISTPQTPEDLINMCAELSLHGNIVDEVLTKLEELDERSEQVHKLLASIQDMLRRRPNRNFEEELSTLKKTHENALRTIQALHKQISPELQKRVQLMATVDDPADLLPKREDTNLSNDTEVIRKLEKLLDKVDEMKQQRSSLLAQLRQSLNDDDVIKHAVSASSEQELKRTLDQEIQKHDKFLAPLRANLNGQDGLMDALEEVNAQYGQIKLNLCEKQKAYDQQVDTFKKYYALFTKTKESIEEGLGYNSKMIGSVKQLHQKVLASQDLNDLLN